MLEKRPLRRSDVNYACKITNAATQMNSRTGEPGRKQIPGRAVTEAAHQMREVLKWNRY